MTAISIDGHEAAVGASLGEREAIGQRQLAVYQSITAAGDRFRLIRTAAALDAVLESWPATQPGDIGPVLLMRMRDSCSDVLDSWHDVGLRIVDPAWMASRYCGGTSEPGPLTDAARQLLDRMARLHPGEHRYRG